MTIYNNDKTFFYKLKSSCKKQWSQYTEHRFLGELVNNKLPIRRFKNYLIQDYIFLQQFLKILSLCAFKSKNYQEMQRYINFIFGIKNEINLHIGYCKKWKISQKLLNSIRVEKSNSDYTNYVLKIGKKGDNFDILTCLSPCIIGYGEIGYKLSKIKNWKKSKYRSWVEMYASKEYQEVAKDNINYLDKLKSENPSKKISDLKKLFKKSTILERDFWETFV